MVLAGARAWASRPLTPNLVLAPPDHDLGCLLGPWVLPSPCRAWIKVFGYLPPPLASAISSFPGPTHTPSTSSPRETMLSGSARKEDAFCWLVSPASLKLGQGPASGLPALSSQSLSKGEGETHTAPPLAAPGLLMNSAFRRRTAVLMVLVKNEGRNSEANFFLLTFSELFNPNSSLSAI